MLILYLLTICTFL